MSRPRLLMLIPNLDFGGAQRVFHDQGVALARRFEITECVFNREQEVAFPTTNRLESLDVSGGGSLVDKARHFGERCARLARLKQELRPDVCLSHLEGADYVNVLSRRGERVVLCVHGTKLHDREMRGPIGRVRRWLLIPALYRRADAIVCVSHEIRRELVGVLGIPGERVHVIQNGFDVDTIEARSRESLPDRFAPLFALPNVVVTSGRLVRQKNHAALLAVHARLVRRVPNAKLVLLGDGDLRDELLGECARLGLRTWWEDGSSRPDLDAQVFFLGFQPNPFAFLARSTVFVLSSGWEGFPMALGEAMACGVPVVSTDCPTGPRELLAIDPGRPKTARAEERTGFGTLMPMLDPPLEPGPVEAWAATLEALLRDENRRSSDARAARRRIEEFSLDAVMRRWGDLLESVIAQSPGRA